MTKYLYKETGMYIDWKQLKNLPDIDTFIDVGVGAEGTPDLYEKFCEKKLVLIDPLDEAEKFYKENMQDTDTIFFKTALGDSAGSLQMFYGTQRVDKNTLDALQELANDAGAVDQFKAMISGEVINKIDY